jgi:hypothetical protein
MVAIGDHCGGSGRGCLDGPLLGAKGTGTFRIPRLENRDIHLLSQAGNRGTAPLNDTPGRGGRLRKSNKMVAASIDYSAFLLLLGWLVAAAPLFSPASLAHAAIAPQGIAFHPVEPITSKNRSLSGIKGVYGMPSVAGLSVRKRAEILKSLQGIDAVFTPADEETIRFFRARGFRVFLTTNGFGGTDAWRRFPDSRPVRADGRFLGEPRQAPVGMSKGFQSASSAAEEELTAEMGGGVCPTHEGWRAERLKEISDWISRFGGSQGIDGIWLDFIRYPGNWEKEAVPDTCYCPRCLRKFSHDRQIELPAVKAPDAAAWIRQNRPYEWMAWKKEQIASFVRQVRAVMSGNRDILLGAFVVPWSKGERDGAVSFLLGQDAFALSEVTDVISPMLYHRMVGSREAWVGDMTAYYGEETRCAVWPIIQAEETMGAEFSSAVRYAALGGADGLLVYSHRGMDAEKRQTLAGFKPPENLIPNPDLKKRGDSSPFSGENAGITAQKGSAAAPVSPWPLLWSVKTEDLGTAWGPRYGLVSSGNLFPANRENRGAVPLLFLAAKGGTVASGEWRAPLPACKPGQTYRLSGLFHRRTWNALSDSYVSVWGQRYLLEKHSPPETLQPLRVKVVCPKHDAAPAFRFINESAADFFYLAKPKLVRGLPLPTRDPAPHGGFFYPDFFPIGVYGADLDNLDEIRKLAVNTVIIGGEGDRLRSAVAACRERGLRYVLSSPHDPERLKVYLDRLAEMGVNAADSHLAFYVDDEPEMRAVPEGRAEDIQRLVKGRFPRASTGMAIVRPSYCREYLRASDFFMIDNYPFPNMPMSWLGESMDRASREAGKDRLLSVIQAFQEGDYWPSLPGWRQMDCLAFLSVVHGSRGIFFFTWSSIGKTEEGRANLGRVVGRLNRIYPWLLEKNLETPLKVEMLSEYRMDPKGRPAVHACLKQRGGEIMLIAVNTIGAPVEARISMEAKKRKNGKRRVSAREAFSGEVYPVQGGAIRTTLQAYETKAIIWGSGL